MNEQDQAAALAAWLDQPPDGRIPADLDVDVVEAVLALQPERAPAAALTADDILADLAAGPLADAPEPAAPRAEGSVVAFPGTEAPEPKAPARRRRPYWLAALGTGGAGIALATAATLLLVALPLLRDPPQEAATAAALEPGYAEQAPSSAAPTRPSEDRASEPEPEAERVAASRPSPAPRARPAASPPPAPAPAVAAPVEEQTYEFARKEGTESVAGLIPEAEQYRADQDAGQREVAQAPEELYGGDAVADLEELDAEEEDEEAYKLEAEPMLEDVVAAPAAGKSAQKPSPKPRPRKSRGAESGADAPASQAAADDANLRQQAVPSDANVGGGWQAGLDGATRSELQSAVDEASTLAAQGDYHGAGTRLLPYASMTPPTAGMAMAGMSASYFLNGGEPGSAASVAQQGLALSQANTAQRAWLLVLYGDAQVRLGNQAAADQAWGDAAGLNTAR